jgi:hypothetical protein
MSETTVASYRMNPAEDVVIFGDELAEGMLVLPEDALLRSGAYGSEEDRLRRQRFRKVTRLRVTPRYGMDDLTAFIGEWIDGYQERQAYAASFAWIVKKDSLPGAAVPADGAA